MKKVFSVFIIASIALACSNDKKETVEEKNNYIAIRTDTVNIVRMTDTLVIYESTCRGCKYEASTAFSISDTADIIKIINIKTTDNNPGDMNGGSIAKTLLLLPQKTGSTTFRFYKFWDIHNTETTAKDSANAQSYTIQVQN